MFFIGPRRRCLEHQALQCAPVIEESDVREIYRTFNAPVVEFDCGQKCAHLNHGIPICCDDSHAIPVLYTGELVYLKKKTDLWKNFRARDEHEREMASELPKEQRFARCKGVQFCERENRSFSCRTFPFFPYFLKDGTFFGLTYYWEYKGRCWILERYDLVKPEYVDGFVKAWEIVFEKLPVERDFFRSYSATARSVHTRLGRPFVVIGRDKKAYLKQPGSEGELVLAPPGPTGPAP
jgi:hypothetical protein